ncbi:ABC transporter ATP-binding protein [Mesorhizobium sp. CO1-1-8]|uniref:ABC transporter ATP-binding protein n=1 Tax=Mesorhizobium sp. CO1-1-8 TaxID=2876631 RepID=UPI001CD123C5|nr:ABC transporter ATP-binding protein [Mesorhizobium sp. CO1-1-8]MBZ9772467.1 ABC transporter ATP-binding protein [Mesorhizobium sp. CO1-1-8]
MLEIKNLTAGYGNSRVLFGIDAVIPQKGGTAILGRNGAGKTTLLKTLIGEVPVSAGDVVLDGVSIRDKRVVDRVDLGIGYVPQEHAVFGTLTVRENLTVGAMTSRGLKEIDTIVDLFPKLGNRLRQVAGTLSGGERKMLAIGRALMGRPKILMLDEPTEGVWFGVIDEITERLHKLSQEMAVIIVEQHLEMALRIANQVLVIDRGRVALSGEPDEVRNDPELYRCIAV